MRNSPSAESFTTRSLPWPSATKMLPSGATRTSAGPSKVSWPAPATPGLPSVIRTRPSAAAARRGLLEHGRERLLGSVHAVRREAALEDPEVLLGVELQSECHAEA